MVTDQLHANHRLQVGHDLGHLQGEGVGVLLALHQRTLQVVAGVAVDARHGNLDAAHVGGESEGRLGAVLVGHKVHRQLEVLALWQRADVGVVAHAADHLDEADLMVSCWGGKMKLVKINSISAKKIKCYRNP